MNWENFGQLGDFMIFQFPLFNLLGKRLVIGQILGNWKGLLVNWKIQNPNLIGNWTLEN